MQILDIHTRKRETNVQPSSWNLFFESRGEILLTSWPLLKKRKKKKKFLRIEETAAYTQTAKQSAQFRKQGSSRERGA